MADKAKMKAALLGMLTQTNGAASDAARRLYTPKRFSTGFGVTSRAVLL
jgi:hypothetical protein